MCTGMATLCVGDSVVFGLRMVPMAVGEWEGAGDEAGEINDGVGL